MVDASVWKNAERSTPNDSKAGLPSHSPKAFGAGLQRLRRRLTLKRDAAEEELGHFAAPVSFFGAHVSGRNERGGQSNGENFTAKNWLFVGNNKKARSPGRFIHFQAGCRSSTTFGRRTQGRCTNAFCRRDVARRKRRNGSRTGGVSQSAECRARTVATSLACGRFADRAG